MRFLYLSVVLLVQSVEYLRGQPPPRHPADSPSPGAMELSRGGGHATVQRTSGTISVWRSLQEAPRASDDDTDQHLTKHIEIRLWSVEELSPNWHPVGHSFNDFHNLTFSLDGVTSATIPLSDQVMADMLPFVANLDSGAYLVGSISVLSRAGSIWQDQVITTVIPGQVLLLTDVCNWAWQDTGNYLDLTLEVKMPPEYKVIDEDRGLTKPMRFILGTEKDAIYPYMDVANVGFRSSDKAWVTMGASYPRYKRGPESEHLLVVRLPWFTGCVTLQYLIEPGYDYPQEGANDDSNAASATSAHFTAIFASVIFIVMKML